MNADWLRKHCLSFPGTSEHLLWGNDLVFKVAGKMFAVTNLEPHAPHTVSFKCSPEDFGELTARPGITPAPYLARALWVAVAPHAALPPAELRRLLHASYHLVVAKLPKRTQASLHQVLVLPR